MNKEEIDMRKAPTKEKEAFFESPALKVMGLGIVLVIILAILYCFSAVYDKDHASNILDLIKVAFGALLGAIAAKAAGKG